MTEAAAEDLLRELSPQVLGAVVRRYGHFDLAEDAVQEALLAAARQWPRDGLPEQPKNWLITVASRRFTDLLRAEQARQHRENEAARHLLPAQSATAAGEADDTLILLFLCCHPSLSAASQIALTLRAVGGLTTAEIARAFLVSEADDDPADHPGEAVDPQLRTAVPAAPGRRTPRAAEDRPARALSDLQRGIRGDLGRAAVPGGVVPGGHSAGPPRAPAVARGRRGGRTAGLDAAHRRPPAGPHHRRRRTRPDGGTRSKSLERKRTSPRGWP